MDITSLNSSANNSVSAVAAVKGATMQHTIITNESNSSDGQVAENKQYTGVTVENQPNENELKDITEKLNNFMQSINTNIKFELHDRTSTLMIQVEDKQTHTVIKEFPAHELLNMLAKIKEYIGVFLDKKV